MLIKIGDKWIDVNLITNLEYSHCKIYQGDFGYALLVYSNRQVYSCGEYETEESVIKAMDEAAEQINAAQGFKPAAREKTTMKYEEHGDEAIVGVYRCSCCKTVIRDEHSWYKYCPACGREIERWE